MVPGERRQHLLQVAEGTTHLSVLLDVLVQQRFVRLSVEALSPRVCAMLPEKRMKLAREDEPHAPTPADPLDYALVQEVRKPLFEIFRQRLFTLDRVQYKNVSGAERGQTFRTYFLEKKEERGVLNLAAQGYFDLVVVRSR